MPVNLSVDNLIKRFDTIKSNRYQWETHWQDCADYCLPQKAIITKIRTPGTKLKTDIYDSTAIQSAQIFAAGLHSYLTNPSSKWFSLKMKERALMADTNVKDWLKASEDIIFDHLNDSNFNDVINEDYVDFGIFGNSVLYEEEDPEDVITFAVRPISEIYFLANHRGRIDTIYRDFTFTARQAFQRWGNNAGQKVLDLISSGKVEEKLSFLHIVLPRDERDVKKKNAVNMPFASLYIEPTTRKILSEGGYEEFPFFVGRAYKVSDSEYAYAPASLAIADVKTVNKMDGDILEAAEKTLHPAVILPHDGYLLPFKTSARAINYKISGSPDERVETLRIEREIGISLEMENQRRATIQRAFFVDLFLMLASLPEKQRTATEIAERVNERMLILGPMLGRLMHEKLDPIITRTFNILGRNFKLPPMPPQLKDKNYKVEYISPLAKAQRASEVKSISDLIFAVGQMAAINQTVTDCVDFDKALKRISEVTNTGEIIQSDDDVKAIRESRSQRQEMQATIDALQRGGPGVKALADADTALKKGENPNAGK